SGLAARLRHDRGRRPRRILRGPLRPEASRCLDSRFRNRGGNDHEGVLFLEGLPLTAWMDRSAGALTFVICPIAASSCNIDEAMSSTAVTQKRQRGLRVKLGGSILALVLLENGRQIRGRMSQLSVNGGLVSLESPLDEAIRVTVLFHLGTVSIRCRARMLFPMWATQGCLQPF